MAGHFGQRGLIVSPPDPAKQCSCRPLPTVSVQIIKILFCLYFLLTSDPQRSRTWSDLWTGRSSLSLRLLDIISINIVECFHRECSLLPEYFLHFLSLNRLANTLDFAGRNLNYHCFFLQELFCRRHKQKLNPLY